MSSVTGMATLSLAIVAAWAAAFAVLSVRVFAKAAVG
jgi:hypothetical protein